MWSYLGKGILITNAVLILIILMGIIILGYKLTIGEGVCVGSIDAATGLYSSSSRGGSWSEINKYRVDVVTCYRLMDK